MYTFEHLYKWRDFALNTKFCLIINKLAFADVDKCFFWPFCEPVDGGAVDEWGEHSESSGKLAAEGTHDNDHVNVSFDSYQILSEDVDFSWRNVLLDAVSFAGWRNVFHLFLLVDTSDIARIENVIDIF